MKFKLLAIMLIIIIESNFMPVLSAFAQTATDSAAKNITTDSDPLTATGSAILQTTTNTAPNTLPSFLLHRHRTPVPMSDIQTQQQASAAVASPAVIEKLIKTHYRSDEDVALAIANPQNKTFHVDVLDAHGQKADVEIAQENNLGAIMYYVSPHMHFRPGKYTITVKDENGKSIQQDFTWGVLAINTNKSIYTPQENADLAMAVLDEQGNMVCDAKVELHIKNQALQIDSTLSTDNNKITVNPVCKSHGFTLTPDYEAHYQVGNAGTYDMTLTAQTKNGTYTINDSFAVKDSVPFSVERQTATRIYPPTTYPVNLTITANQDFSGKITEVVPENFIISQTKDATVAASQSNAVTPYDSVEKVSLSKKGKAVSGASVGKIGMPFNGTHPVTLDFSQHLIDSQEKDLYAKFGLNGHDGIDFGMSIGTPILAVDDGEIQLAGAGPYGTTVVMKHAWGKSYYGHLSSTSAQLNQRVTKGEQIGLSGTSGIVTGPHLHFGIKPDKNDPKNGYYGKIDPAVYLGLKEDTSGVLGAATSSLTSNDVQVVTWKVTVKKGDKITLGYNFKAPNISPQFYTLGPLTFYNTNGETQFQETRPWQIASDAPTTAYSDGASTPIGITSTSLASLATSFADSNNLIVATVSFGTSAGSQIIITAGNLILQNGSTTLASNASAIKTGTTTPRQNLNYMFVYKDSGATANPTYNVKATASATGLNGEVKIIVLHGIPQSSFNDGTNTSLGTTDTTLATTTMSAAGDNVIIAAVQSYNTDTTSSRKINAGAEKITSGASTLTSNQYVLNIQADTNINLASEGTLLIARDPGAAANKTYNVVSSAAVGAVINAQARILVLNGVDSAYSDGASTTLSNASDTTVTSVATSFAAGTNVVLAANQIHGNTTTGGPFNVLAGNQKMKSGTTLLTSNTFNLTAAINNNVLESKGSGLLYVDSGALASPTYNLTGMADTASSVDMQSKVVVLSLASPSYTQASYQLFNNPTSPSPTIEQEINVWDDTQTSVTGTGNQGIVLIDTGAYSGTVTYYLEVVAKVTSGTGSVSLTYNAGTAGIPSGGSTVTVSNISTTNYARYRSSSFSPTGEQNAYISALAGTGISVQAVRIIIDQTNATSINNTATQIEVGNLESGAAGTTDHTLVNPKYWKYDTSKYDGTVAVYFEASGLNSTNPDTWTASLYVAGASCTTQVTGSSVTSSTNTAQTLKSGDISANLSTGTTYMVCVHASANLERLKNAKIVIKQTSSNGLTKMELQRITINKGVTNATSTYTSQNMFNQFDPTQYTRGTFTYYFEATLNTTAGTGYAQLYNNTDSSAISSSEVTTTSTSDTLVRSSSITMPSAAKDMDSQIKNSATNTTTVEGSWFIVDVTGLPLSYDVGSLLAAANTGINVTTSNQTFRLRMNINVANNQVGSSAASFKLQYIDRGTGADCTTAANGNPSAWTDVTNSTAIAYNVQAGLTNGTALTSNANDPTDGGNTINKQTYNDANNFTNSVVWIPKTQDGMWDFSLINNVNMIDDATNVFPNRTFCFRAVLSDGTVFGTYSNYPSYTVMPVKVMRHGKWFSSDGVKQPFTF